MASNLILPNMQDLDGKELRVHRGQEPAGRVWGISDNMAQTKNGISKGEWVSFWEI